MIEAQQATNLRTMALNAEFVERRYQTIVDAFLTEDRRRRGYLVINRCLELYQVRRRAQHASRARRRELTRLKRTLHSFTSTPPWANSRAPT